MSEKPQPPLPADDSEARFDDEGSAIGHPEPDETGLNDLQNQPALSTVLFLVPHVARQTLLGDLFGRAHVSHFGRGKITETQGDKMKSRLSDAATKFVNHTKPEC